MVEEPKQHPTISKTSEKNLLLPFQIVGEKATAKLGFMDLEQARKYILDRLDNGLPEDLSYHSPAHTRDVVVAALRIGRSEGIQNEDLLLLETAALYHDAGFLQQYHQHEEQSCKIAREALPGFGYSSSAIDLICETIMATRIPQQPQSHLAQVLCDADLDYLGSETFYRIGNGLFVEFVKYGVVDDEKAWNRMQVRFLESHAYFTETAKREREPNKQQRLKEVRAIVKGYGD